MTYADHIPLPPISREAEERIWRYFADECPDPPEDDPETQPDAKAA